MQKHLTFFWQKMALFLCTIHLKINVSLTNNLLGFEEPGPDSICSNQIKYSNILGTYDTISK